MSTTTDPATSGHRIAILDEDPLRARREARELLAALTEADARAALDVPRPRPEDETLKGGPVAELIGLVFSGVHSPPPASRSGWPAYPSGPSSSPGRTGRRSASPARRPGPTAN